ncbi:MAG: hypothetical protein ACRDYV_18285, partial [Acidimicrobiia bacterium]
IESDQRFWDIFAGLILAGATFGAFNLASRMVEAQRREIGVGMALGWPRHRLAVRPLLVGARSRFSAPCSAWTWAWSSWRPCGRCSGASCLCRCGTPGSSPGCSCRAPSSASCCRCWPRPGRCGGPCG